jgi:predicted transcriptional regulator
MEHFGHLQIRIMQHLWRNGPSTVHDIHDALNAEPGARQLAYTTFLTVMRSLAKRQLLRQEAVGRFHRFTPTTDEETFNRMMVVQLRDELFGGNAESMIACLRRAEAGPDQRKG